MNEINLGYIPHRYKCSYDGVYLVHRFITPKGGIVRIREFGDYLDPKSLQKEHQE